MLDGAAYGITVPTDHSYVVHRLRHDRHRRDRSWLLRAAVGTPVTIGVDVGIEIHGPAVAELFHTDFPVASKV